MKTLPRVVEDTPQGAWGAPSQHLGEYVQLPWGECSTSLGIMFNYLGEFVTLGSMFNYLGEYVQLPWGVCSTTLGSMFTYPGEYAIAQICVVT